MSKQHLINQTKWPQARLFNNFAHPGNYRRLDWKAGKLENGNEVDIVYIDFQKDSDSAQHQTLLGSITEYGIRGSALTWIRDFLFGKKQRGVINGSYSKWAKNKSGNPQSSVIGPVLFIVFRNSTFSCVSRKKYLYADDAKLNRAVKNDKMQHNFSTSPMRSRTGPKVVSLNSICQIITSLY